MNNENVIVQVHNYSSTLLKFHKSNKIKTKTVCYF